MDMRVDHSSATEREIDEELGMLSTKKFSCATRQRLGNIGQQSCSTLLRV